MEQNVILNQEKERENVQIRRVGSITFGITLVCYGILFLVHIFDKIRVYIQMLAYHFHSAGH